MLFSLLTLSRNTWFVLKKNIFVFCCVRNFFKNPECFWFLASSACHFLSEKMSYTARHAKSIRPEDPWTICLRKCVLQTCGKSNQIVLCCGGAGMCRSCTSKHKVEARVGHLGRSLLIWFDFSCRKCLNIFRDVPCKGSCKILWCHIKHTEFKVFENRCQRRWYSFGRP